jgi:hypothetical protein
MQVFQLPVIREDDWLKTAVQRMIADKTSGVVLESQGRYRLLHFDQVRAAFQEKLNRITEMSGLRDLEFNALEADDTVDFEILEISDDNRLAILRSRLPSLSYLYTAASAAYACDGPQQHTYPPLRRGAGNRCVVPGCPGKI